MFCEYSHTKAESFAQIRTTMAEIQYFFSRGLSFIGAPCRPFSLYREQCLSEKIVPKDSQMEQSKRLPVGKPFFLVYLEKWLLKRDVGVGGIFSQYPATVICVFRQIFLSKSYDATSHFETTCHDVLDIFRRATGADFDFSNVKHNLDDIE